MLEAFYYSGNFIRVVLAVTGVAMLMFTIMSLARRKMNETVCMAWGIVSAAIIIAAIVIHPDQWSDYISFGALLMIAIIFFGVLYAGFFVSAEISKLTRCNQELAIQVSLLNEENQRLLKRVAKLSDVDIRNL